MMSDVPPPAEAVHGPALDLHAPSARGIAISTAIQQRRLERRTGGVARLLDLTVVRVGAPRESVWEVLVRTFSVERGGRVTHWYAWLCPRQGERRFLFFALPSSPHVRTPEEAVETGFALHARIRR